MVKLSPVVRGAMLAVLCVAESRNPLTDQPGSQISPRRAQYLSNQVMVSMRESLFLVKSNCKHKSSVFRECFVLYCVKIIKNNLKSHTQDGGWPNKA